MAIKDDSIDTCGTGRHTPPPTYQTASTTSTQDGLRQINFLHDPQNSIRGYNHTPNYTYELVQIKNNTECSAESVLKIREMMEGEDGLLSSVRDIRQLLHIQDGILNSFVSIFSIVLVIHLLVTLYNLYKVPNLSLGRPEESKAVTNLNLSENDMQIILHFAKRYVLVDLKDCISRYLSSVQ